MLKDAAAARAREWATAAFYWFMTRSMALVLRIFGRWEVRGAERMPAAGPLLVASNHLNNADPPLLGASFPRRIHFMAKQELLDVPLGGFFIRLFGAFPVRRDEADLRALRVAQRLLASGRVIGMFPEGHRSPTSTLQRAHPGTALLALRTGTPILPVAITGTEQIDTPRILLKRPRITVTVGEPFAFPAERRITSARVSAASDEIMQHIAALLPKSYRGVYSGEEVQEHGDPPCP
jgi:1-acyl-sn-glycerol-3-phosphate acyltransferase